MAIIWKASIPVASNGTRSDRSAPSVASSIPPARSWCPGWLKLWGNVCFNPISALTGATLDRITGEPALRALCKTMMLETRAVNEALGIQIPLEMMDRRLAAAGSVVGHKMSMLQDLERGRSLEIDALVTAVQELGRLTGVATPVIDAVLALVQERARAAGLYAHGA